MLQLIPDYIEKYAHEHTKVGAQDVLKLLERKTNLEVLLPQMLSGFLQGQYLAFVSRMLKPNRILEIGTFTGYSAICLAQGLTVDGQLHTIDHNLELEELATTFIEKADLTDKVVQHQGDALTIIPTIQEQWELVFMDADKVNYSNYYDLLMPHLPIGAYIIADNVLWSGEVAKGSEEKRAAALGRFNDKVMKDKRVKNVLLPIRDGLMMIEKVSD